MIYLISILTRTQLIFTIMIIFLLDDVSCYEKAWDFSNHKSSRAQRHWGNFLFDHKRYNECIPHYETSVSINSIQESVWLRLG